MKSEWSNRVLVRLVTVEVAFSHLDVLIEVSLGFVNSIEQIQRVQHKRVFLSDFVKRVIAT